MGENDGGPKSNATSPVGGAIADLNRGQPYQSKKLRPIKPKIYMDPQKDLISTQSPPPPSVSAFTVLQPNSKQSQQHSQIQINSSEENRGRTETLCLGARAQAITLLAPNYDPINPTTSSCAKTKRRLIRVNLMLISCKKL